MTARLFEVGTVVQKEFQPFGSRMSAWTAPKDEYLKQADVEKFQYLVTKLSEPPVVGTLTEIPVAQVIFDTLQTSADRNWITDAKGYNALWDIPGSEFTEYGVDYSVEIYVTLNGQAEYLADTYKLQVAARSKP